MKINEIWSYMTKRDDASIQCCFCARIFSCTIKPSISDKNHAFTKITIAQFNLEEELLQHLLANHIAEKKEAVEDDKIKVSLIDRKNKKQKSSAKLKERAKGSPVWKYFTKCQNEPGKAKCNICQTKLSFLFHRSKKRRISSLQELESTTGSLYNHLRDKHALLGARAQTFLCSHCGKQFSRNSRKIECEAKHVGDARLKCSFEGCSMQFSTFQGTQRHFNDVHMKIKPHICDTCGKAFAQGEHLRTHSRVHTGETPYECEKCRKKFKFLASRNSHKCIAP